ncbi:hypothetical protein [Burkholderia sp. Ac-20344]|uniref:immunity protein Imm33 domain-containing protein n=1 Tax=Burkholderia sp. Ac-20344 TaxID=2703890 RepID=UPI001F12131E|nr:hypothetical protein [Burkholderia sp. Ac-20344]
MESRHETAIAEMQREVCERYGLQETAVENMVAFATSTVGQMPVYGTRLERGPDDNISWYFHCGEYSDADDFYQPVHTEHLQQMLPLVIKYLRLPPGTRFIVDDQGYEDVWREPA